MTGFFMALPRSVILDRDAVRHKVIGLVYPMLLTTPCGLRVSNTGSPCPTRCPECYL